MLFVHAIVLAGRKYSSNSLVTVTVMADEYTQSETNQHTHDVFSLHFCLLCYLHSIDNY